MYATEGFFGYLMIIFIIDTIFLTSATQKLLVIFTAQPTLSAKLPQF